MSLSIPFTFVGGPGRKAKASEVNANFQAVANKFTEGSGGINNSDISANAGIYGTKLSNTAGNRIPTDRVEDDAIDKDKLKDDASAGSPNAAVNTALHIKDRIITAVKLALASITNAEIASATILYGNVKFQTFTQAGSSLAAGPHSYDTGLLGASFQPLTVWFENNSTPGNEQNFTIKSFRDTVSDHWYLEVNNLTAGNLNPGQMYMLGISKT